MSYVTVAELAAALGGPVDPARGQDAVDSATVAIDVRCAQSFPNAVYPVVPPPVKQAALLLAGRWYVRPLAPLGTQGGFDSGAVYVLSRDPDVERLLVGFRVGFGVA